MSGIIGGAGSKSGVIGETELDYETGTWTPAIVGSQGSAGTWANTGQEGDYIKIGKIVYFSMYAYVSNAGSYSGTCQINGLPYACTGFGNQVACSTSAYPFNVTTNVGATVLGGQSFIRFSKGAYNETNYQWSEQVNGHSTSVAGCYHIA